MTSLRVWSTLVTRFYASDVTILGQVIEDILIKFMTIDCVKSQEFYMMADFLNPLTLNEKIYNVHPTTH